MNDDNSFRLFFMIIVASFMPFAVYCRVRSQTDEKLDRWQEGAFILFGLRLSGIPMFGGLVAWLINPQWMAWSSMPLPDWLRWIGLAIVGFCGVLVVWTFRTLGRNLTDTVVTRREHSLVTSGPYRFVRHPFYLAFALGIIGGSLVAANWFLLLAGIIPFGFLVVRTRIEEEKLIERFGHEYRDYMQRVGRFLPRLKA
ncbi:MAG: isoprenylcysteine carboxylmethyltransferase family protein [Pirellulales bacterium]